MSDKLGQESAFPLTDSETFANNGMSKRFYAACCVMQGMCADPNIMLNNPTNITTVVKIAYNVADELLRQENEV
jgi:hypothetical protein